MLNLISKYNF